MNDNKMRTTAEIFHSLLLLVGLKTNKLTQEPHNNTFPIKWLLLSRTRLWTFHSCCSMNNLLMFGTGPPWGPPYCTYWWWIRLDVNALIKNIRVSRCVWIQDTADPCPHREGAEKGYGRCFSKDRFLKTDFQFLSSIHCFSHSLYFCPFLPPPSLPPLSPGISLSLSLSLAHTHIHTHTHTHTHTGWPGLWSEALWNSQLPSCQGGSLLLITLHCFI